VKYFMSPRPWRLIRAAVLVCLASAAGAQLAEGTTFQGQWQKIVPLRQGVFSIAMGNQINKAPSETGRPEGSSFLLGSLDRLSPPILRLPGGDMLNNWSWVAGHSLESEGTGGLLMRPSDFLKLVRAGHATGLWGVNPASAPPSDSEFLAKALMEQGARPQFFELGNELYLPNWTKMTPAAEVYAEKAAPHAEVLRKYFPQAKLGVPLASYRQLKAGGATSGTASNTQAPFAWKKAEELDSWMLGLAKRQDFYDAVVLHLYLVPTELGMAGLAEHTADEICRWAWVRSDARQIQDLFGLVHGVFPTKDIWVTEWAFNATQYIGGKSGGNKDVRFQVHQTMLAVLYNARFMLNTAYYVPYVPVMTIWTLYEQPACAILKEDKTAINFELFRMLRWAREGCDGLARLELSGVPMWKGPAGPQGFDKIESQAGDVFGFYQGDKLQSVMILNVLSKPVSVTIPNLSESEVRDGRALCSEGMLPDWGNPNNPGAAQWWPPYRYEKVGIHGNMVTVPANSLSVVHVSKQLN
jgi:hypothetical protein